MLFRSVSTIPTYHMVFSAIPSKFSCATFKNFQNTSQFVTLFLAHEEVVVGYVIFQTDLSTPLTRMLHQACH